MLDPRISVCAVLAHLQQCRCENERNVSRLALPDASQNHTVTQKYEKGRETRPILPMPRGAGWP